VLEEITERKEREAALQRFRTALDSSADMVFLFRVRDGALLDFNETVCTELGYTHDELLTLRPTDMRSDTTPESLRARLPTCSVARAQQHRGSASTAARTAAPSRWRAGAASSTTPQGRVLVVNSRDLSERTQRRERRATQARYQKKIARLGQSAARQARRRRAARAGGTERA